MAKGTIYDISIGWKAALIREAKALIENHQIVNVMASGAPWKMLYDVAELKILFPHLNIIIDYRDPWLNALNYGMPGLNQDRRNIEEQKQTFILDHASVIVTPYAYLTEELRMWNKIHCKNRPEFAVLTHFFDAADLTNSTPVSKEKITIVYGGDLYQGIEKELQLLKKDLLELRKKHRPLYDKLSVKIFTNTLGVRTFEDIEAVQISPSIGKEIFREVICSSCVLIFLSENKKHDRTTKFFENLPARKPYLIISEEGEVTSFVRENKLGYILNSTCGSLTEFLQLLEEDKLEFNNHFNYEQYELKEVTTKLISMFK